MRVALIGATGVLGRALIPRLLAKGARVRALARSPDSVKSGGQSGLLGIAQFDLLHPDAEMRLRKLLPGCDAVIHAATAIPSDPRASGAWDTNTRLRTYGTRALLAASVASGVRQYVQQSIAMAYVGRGDQWIDEGCALDSSGVRAKICAPVVEMERLVGAASPALRCSVLRGGNFVGPGTSQDRLIASMHAGSEPIIAGGVHFLPLVHVDDVADAFVLAIERAPAGAILNINDEPIRQRDYLLRLAAMCGAPQPAETAGTPPPSFRCSNGRAASILGWRPSAGIWPRLFSATT